MRREIFLAFLFFLSLTAFIFASALVMPLRVFAAPAISVGDVSGALFAETGTHFEMNALEENITFTLSAEGIPDGADLFFRTSIASGNVIASMFPSRSALKNASEGIISVTLAKNLGTESIGELLITFEYENNNQLPPPRAMMIQIIQPPSAVPPQPTVPDTTNEERAIVSMLESATVMPEVSFSGTTAILSYSQGGAVSWSGGNTGAQLTIRDVSVLSRNSPLVLEDYRPTVNGVLSQNRYSVTIPRQQISHVLAKYADEIAKIFPRELTLIEDIFRSNDAETFLVPTQFLELPRGTTVSTTSTFAKIPNAGSLVFSAETARLTQSEGRDIDVLFSVLYNEVPSSQNLRAVVRLSQPEFFPSAFNSAENFPGENFFNEENFSAENFLFEFFETNQSVPFEENFADEFSQQGLTQTFDSARNVFIQRLAQNLEFTSNIPNGIVTNERVNFSFPTGIEFAITRDDEPFLYYNTSYITYPGSYRVRVSAAVTLELDTSFVPSEITLEDIANMQELSLSDWLDTSGDTLNYEGEFVFRIVSGMTNSLAFFNPPEGYKITALTYRDVPVTNFSGEYLHLQSDGEYGITFSANDNESEFTTHVTRFTSPPLLTVSGVKNGETTAKPVSFRAESPEAGIANIRVWRDNIPVSAREGVLSAPGFYRITATDNAGNTSSVNFQILFSVNISGWVAVLILVFVVGGISGTMYYLRTHMRVR
ncbi:MAG: hypothetical protein FWD19_00040 [Defluviitaleaceae bacterium]|nr:hypothetical protein [Defluviitaleaceae bacterium]